MPLSNINYIKLETSINFCNFAAKSHFHNKNKTYKRMKHSLLLSLAASVAATAFAQGEVTFSEVSMIPNVHKTYVKATHADNSSRPIKKAPGIKAGGKSINPLLQRAKARKAAAAGNAANLHESFESWDGQTSGWIPAGWSVQSNSTEGLTDNQKWNVCAQPGYYFPAPTDGKYYLNISVAGKEKPQDEMLISPVFTVGEDMEFSFDLYTACAYYYDWQYYQPDDMTFTEFKPIGDVCVLIREEGTDEWHTIYSMTEANTGKSADQMLGGLGILENVTVSIAEYAGKNVQIAIRYYGTDCDSVYLDNIIADYPAYALDPYMEPFETMFYGFNKELGWTVAGAPIAIYPAYNDLVWQNYTYDPKANFTWTYHDQKTNSLVTSDDPDMLILNYTPDFTSESTTRNNLFLPPTLSAVAPGFRESTFTPAHLRMQIGGKAEVAYEDGTTEEYGILPFDPINMGITEVYAEHDFGDRLIPILGSGEGVNEYWTRYTFDNAPTEQDNVTLDALVNFIYPSASPFVVRGAHMLAMGKVSDEAEIKLEILAMVDDYVIDGAPVLASAVCKGSDMLRYEYGDTDYLTLSFTLDTPVALDMSNLAYAVRISGFDGAGVEYFSPMVSELPHPYLCHGWIEKTITSSSYGSGKSWSPLANIQNEYGDMYAAFAINLNGEYPYLHSDEENINIPNDGTPVTVALSSYYDGADLTVEAPAGVEASVSGRYGKTVLTARHNDADVIAQGTLTVSGPGVKKTFNVTEVAGIDGIATDTTAATPVEYYTPDGKQVSAAAATSGLFIVKYSDGSVRKLSL